MKRYLCLVVLLTMALAGADARAGLDDFMNGLNVQAKASPLDFEVRLSSRFGVPVPEVKSILKTVVVPADAFMCLQLAVLTGRPPATVVRVYEQHRGRGWGVIAKELGIKPGSQAFHDLKSGNFSFSGAAGPPAVTGHGLGKGQKVGKDKWKGPGKGHQGQGQGQGKGKGKHGKD